MTGRLDARAMFLCLIMFIVAALHARTMHAVGLCLIAAIAAACFVQLDVREAWRAFRPLVPIAIITVVMQVLTNQAGEVFVRLGVLVVTREALLSSCRMVLVLVSIMVASLSFMRCTTTEGLMLTIRWLLRPFRAIGLRVDACVLSLNVAFRFIPVLIDEFEQLKRAQQARFASFEGKVRVRLSAYMRLFAPLVRSSFRRADMLGEAFLTRCFSCGIEATALHSGCFGIRECVVLLCTAVFSVATFLL